MSRHKHRPVPPTLASESVPATLTPEQHYEAARLFARAFEPKPGVDYTWVIEYARKAFEITDRRAELIDAKAEKLVAFTATAAGLMVAVLAKAEWQVAALAAPSVLAALVAVHLGLSVLRPASQTDLPGVEDAIDMAEWHGEKAEAMFAAVLHRAREGRRVTIAAKARALKHAYLGILVATWGLAAPLIGALIRHH